MRSLTLLSGTNSAGKTTVLHALALLRQSDDAQTLPGAWMLNGDLVEVGSGRDLLHADPMEIAGTMHGLAVEIQICSDSGETTWAALYDAEADVLDASESNDHSHGTSLFTPGFQYLKADRIVPAVTFPKSHEAVRVRKWLGSRGEHAPNYLRVHGDSRIPNRAAMRGDAKSPSLLDQTNAWLGELSPGTTLAVEDVPGTDFVRLSYARTGPDIPTSSQRSTNVGFGLTYALPIIIAALSAQDDTLLLIENPEAHLHPAGQAMVGRLCALAAANGAQVIVESHSDHVLNAVRLSVKRKLLRREEVLLHFFSREANVLEPELVSIEVEEDGSLGSWPRGFFDQWDEALDALLG